MRHGRPWWYARFMEEGIKFTLPRKAIIDVLERSSKHLSAEDIYFIVHKLYPNIGFATVYRTLDLLTRLGIVVKLNFGDGRARYELLTKKKGMHVHLVCENCGKVIEDGENGNDMLKKMEEQLSKKHNFKIKNLKVYFIGECEKCQKGGDGKCHGVMEQDH